MADLSYRNKQDLESLFEMGEGYVMDFSNKTFARFIRDIINIDIYHDTGYTEYCSKAKKLRQIWSNEPNSVVGTLLVELLNYCEDYKIRENNLTDYDTKKIKELHLVAENLKYSRPTINLPQKNEEEFKTLKEDIDNALDRGKPELALDRLHIFSIKLLREICSNNNIITVNNKDKNLPLHSLAGSLKKKYEQEPIFHSTFVPIAIQNSILIFEKYNTIRNRQSYAHDNPILDPIEAEFAIRIMAEVISFIDKAETYRKKISESNMDTEIGFD